MEQQLGSLQPELWHPYSKPEGTRADQSTAGIGDYLSDSRNTAGFDRVTAGL